MNSHVIDGMLKALAPVLTSRTKARAILERYWRDRIAIVWDLGHVHTAANEQNTVLTNEEAREILQKLHTFHNRQYGINWATLTEAIKDSGKGRVLTKAELKRFVGKNVITIGKR